VPLWAARAGYHEQKQGIEDRLAKAIKAKKCCIVSDP
jgi:hypothetical protein